MYSVEKINIYMLSSNFNSLNVFKIEFRNKFFSRFLMRLNFEIHTIQVCVFYLNDLFLISEFNYQLID